MGGYLCIDAGYPFLIGLLVLAFPDLLTYEVFSFLVPGAAVPPQVDQNKCLHQSEGTDATPLNCFMVHAFTNLFR